MTRAFWLDVLRHGLRVLALCLLVALFNSVIWPDTGYLQQLVYSVCIGVPIWLTVEFGRLLVPRRHCIGQRDGDSHGWPAGWRGALLPAAGIAVGFSGGTRLAHALLGESPQISMRDLRVTLAITIATTIVATFYFYTRGREAALRASIAAAERDATQSRLMLLQSQLEPHMLFNTLANLRALIAVDPAAAQQMLDRLDGYLRATLGASRATQHALAAEFERLRDYLELMAVRMGPRLAYRLDLPEALRERPVPTLLLQPLVENAIRHGLEPRIEGGRIDVTARADHQALVLTVKDSGVGFDSQAARRPGSFGLTQVIERIASSTDGRGRVDVQSQPGAGTTVRIHLPA